jgi:hypothetical protein
VAKEGANHSLLSSNVRVPGHVVFRPFAGEMVVLNLQTGRYHGLNPTGGRIFEVLSKATTVREAANALATRYDRPVEELEQHVCDFCADLLEQGLIEMNGRGST